MTPIDRQSPTPLYEQIKLVLRDQILTGHYPPGSQLPSENNLCAQYGVSRITAVRALRDLEGEGLIERVQGKGSMVASHQGHNNRIHIGGHSRISREQGVRTHSRVIGVETIENNRDLARLFRLPLTEPRNFMRIRRLRFMDDTPAVIMNSIMIESLGKRMLEFDVGAVLASLQAGRLRLRAQDKDALQSSLRFTPDQLWRALGLLLLAAIFTPAYSFGLSYGLKSISQPMGLAVLPFMAMLVTGAYIGSWLTSGMLLTRNRQWQQVFSAPWSIHRWGVLSGLAHYGGNIIHTFATSFLSSVVTWPLGITAGLWTQFWGLVYGEFRGSTRATYLALFAGILLYILGVYFVATA